MIVKIQAKDIIEAKGPMVIYMNNQIGGKEGTKYTAADIDSIGEEIPEIFVTYDEQLKKYKEKYGKEPPDEIIN